MQCIAIHFSLMKCNVADESTTARVLFTLFIHKKGICQAIYYLFTKLIRVFASIGPLQNTVTWYKKHIAGWQTTLRVKKYKEITSFKKLK